MSAISLDRPSLTTDNSTPRHTHFKHTPEMPVLLTSMAFVTDLALYRNYRLSPSLEYMFHDDKDFALCIFISRALKTVCVLHGPWSIFFGVNE